MASTTEPPPPTNTAEPETPRNESNDPPVLPPSHVKPPQSDCPSFSQLLEGVVRAANSASAHQAYPMVVEKVRLEVQFKMSHQEALACVTAKATESQVRAQGHQLPTEGATSSDTSPITRTEPALPPSITQRSQSSSSSPENKVNNSCVGQKRSRSSSSQEKPLLSLPESKTNNAACSGDKRISSSGAAIEPICDTPRAPHSDGYSWRKYGQKQVKTPESSRSYYRCTRADCNVKKTVQHSEKSGQIIAVDYRGKHSHDPPPLIQRSHKGGNSIKKQTAAVESMVKKSVDLSFEQKLDDVSKSSSGNEHERSMVVYSESDKNNPDDPTHSKGRVAREEQKNAVDEVKRRPEAMQLALVNHAELSNSSDHTMTDTVKESNVITGQKRRMKERSKECPVTPQRNHKEHKIVVHSAGYAAISSDGYRWRKYGQKIVKGNPHPRSYYRCTSAGCPVRKHVERAIDNSAAIVVTYEGKHDHDTPVPKKPSACSPSTAVVSAVSAAGNNTSSCQVESTQAIQVTSIQPKQENTSENAPDEKKTSEVGTENKMLESAQTLLSIGIELKSC